MEKIIDVYDSSLIKGVFGNGDRNLDSFEGRLGVKIHLKSEGIAVNGPKAAVDKAALVLTKLISLAKEGLFLNREEVEKHFTPADKKTKQTEDHGLRISLAARKKVILPKTAGQKKYLAAIKDYDIIFSIGPAGTGKTYLAMAMAVQCLLEGRARRIVLTRPAIEAGESLGFLPGDIYQKLGPYLRPLYDALYDMIAPETIDEYLETGIIEVAPLAYMRGRTLNNAFIIFDEAQNCTPEQLKMFLTRLGFNSKTIITGDITQSDLPGGKPKGLLDALKILMPIKGIKFIRLTNKDVVRHPLIQKIIKAYERFYSDPEG
ncbi:MAG: PhoH family protein [Candidatus Omnitrophota bacterium]